jgi:DNA-binding XRE family transcriptional regulator
LRSKRSEEQDHIASVRKQTIDKIETGKKDAIKLDQQKPGSFLERVAD